MDRGLNSLLKWGVENSTTSANESNAPPQSSRELDPAVLSALLGGPSDAELMQEAMAVILSPDPEVTLDDQLIAFDNFEQLIESLDNANNLEQLSLWTPLLSCLGHAEHEIRRMAAWCVGTAVQNNIKSQERCLAMGGIPALVDLAVKTDEDKEVRRKAIYALSSECRNYQPAMDVFTGELDERGRNVGKIDAADMDAIDTIMAGLREEIAKKT
jgi:hsp70-interacting protein